jgi:formylglycine-generating enzyme required for sulfatase activity
MVLIPAGSFIMGSPDSESERWKNEGPQRQVNISGFAIGETEVTQGQWRAIMGSNPSGFSSCGDNCPVENVSWDEAQAYIKKLIAKTGQRYRLPSEAEWEYAARAGTSSRFHTGDCITTDQANVRGDYCSNVDFWQRRTLPVGSLAANAWGLYDIHGNVWEWVEDCWNDTYMGAPSGGIAWTGGDCSRRVQRGGSWHGGGWEARSASRSDGGPSAFRNDSLGFRLARSVF